MVRQTSRHPRDIKTVIKSDIQTYIQTSRDQDKQTEKHPDIKQFRITDKQTRRQANIEKSRYP